MFKKDIVNSKLRFWDGLKMMSAEVPTFTDIAFKEKWHSIYYRYESARWYLLLAKGPGYECLYKSNSTDEKQRKYFELQRQIDFYEGALTFYNMLVNYSWQLTFFSYEFACYSKDEIINLTKPISIEDAKKALKKLEHSVTNPFDEENPFSYFAKDNKFSEIGELVNDFWKRFSVSNIRNSYNIIKHCGNMVYEELNEFFKMPFKITASIGEKEIPISVIDVQDSISLVKSIDELIKFDNDELMPYLEELVEKLNLVVNPAKNVF